MATVTHGEVLLIRCWSVVACWPLTTGGEGDGERPAVDLELVDELARLHVAARRAGYQLYIRRASGELSGLLEVVGLRGLLVDGPRLPGRQVLGQTEPSEQRGVQEVVMPDDPVA